ncbi:hypothetical protein N7509_006768 [Penicillium cosmopolitanum]|uniref:FAD-binding domain-containing protein n=1 Tax=Penicillium cosmopolitanum TaxID=1131564 RepID=A0A9W9VXK0_9EURO|nr:uncharacterized protein N7509_006768 [Penicillium cosmopolitanum]KAJ5391278.1 hypothetical protein N7509_006768 [Penicillium cosmopolitanum]
MSELDCEATDVVICGCGPTGAMLSAYLGQMNIRNIVLERGTEITTDPRGIALDEDGIRLLQGLGLYASIYTQIGTCMNMFKFIGGTTPILDKPAFIEMDYGTTEGGTGHVGFICHKQPVLEKKLRERMSALEECELRSGCEVTALSEDEDGTLCIYRDSEGKERRIKSLFFVGADGKTGFTRKRYLESKGIVMEQAHRAFYEETWVALNWQIELPNEKTHSDFPLWKLGYTPEQVYDLFFPVNFRFICNPDRPSVCGRFGLPLDRLWRFEFVVRKDEDGNEMSKPEMIQKVVYPYITHAGSRYGLLQDVTFPEDCIKVLRSRPFRFSARSCNRWSDGRVVLCGDAAHVFPPFGGQGIASGFWDAVSLAWRLAILCRKKTSSPNSEKVLKAWYEERKQQLEKSLASTIENGKFVTERNPLKITLRGIYLWLIQLIPSWRHELRLGRRKEGMVRYNYSEGMPFLQKFKGGLCLPQVYCKSIGSDRNEIFFTDDVIFSQEKKGLFQLLIIVKSVKEAFSALDAVSNIGEISNGEMDLHETTILVEDAACGTRENAPHIFRVVTGKEFASSPLCEKRPSPEFYDPFIIGKHLEGMKFVLLRPDRFIFAACGTKDDLQSAVQSAVSYIKG